MRNLEHQFSAPAEEAEELGPENEPRQNLISKESGLLEKVADRIKEAKDSKNGKKVVKNLLRVAYAIELSTLLAHGAFAQEGNKNQEVSDTATTQTTDSAKKSWLNRLAGEVSVSYNAEQINRAKPSEKPTQADLRRDVNITNWNEKEWDTYFTYQNIVASDTSFENFNKTLNEKKESWDQEQKVLFLRQLARGLRGIYDFSALKNNQFFDLSDHSLFETLHASYSRQGLEAGMCATHHSFVADVAASLGIQSWVQQGDIPHAGHEFTGLLLQHNGKNEIAFLDYGSLIMTGTDNYRDALGVAERFHERVRFNAGVSDPGEKQLVDYPLSKAQQKIREVSGHQEVDSIAANESEPQKNSRKLEINLSQETQELKIEQGLIGLDYVNYHNANDYFNSLAELQSIRLSAHANIKGVHLMGNIAEIHMNLKTLRGDTLAAQKMMTRNYAADYFKNQIISRSKYGEFAARVGLIAQASINTTSNAEALEQIIYINPSETGKFYIQAEQIKQDRGLGPRYQTPNPRGISKFKLGGTVKVKPAEIVNFEAEMRKSIDSKNYSASAEFITDNFTFEVHGRKDVSDLPTLNSGQSIDIELGKRFVANNVPQAELNLYWSTGSEKEQQSNNAPQFGLKARVYIW